MTAEPQMIQDWFQAGEELEKPDEGTLDAELEPPAPGPVARVLQTLLKLMRR